MYNSNYNCENFNFYNSNEKNNYFFFNNIYIFMYLCDIYNYLYIQIFSSKNNERIVLFFHYFTI